MNRIVIVLICIVFIILGAVLFNYLQPSASEELPETEVTTLNEDNDFQILRDNILSGGPPKDGIPPIDEPIYISVAESDYLNDEEKVFVYEADEGIFIYPQRILVWHEIVNDVIDDEQLAITYCPLTGSTICYLGDANHPDNTYGTSGKLLNSNLVMYDRKTDSYIPQILGIGINNTLENTILPSKPIHWANWNDAKALYPHAKVLSLETGFFRDYNSDPYGSYLPDTENSYYHVGGPIFPVLNISGEFQDKKIVTGIKHGNEVIAIDPLLVRKEKYVEFKIHDLDAVAIFDENLKTTRVFSRTIDGQVKNLRPVESGLEDDNGQIYAFTDEALTPLVYFDVMWFAWYAYYPETEVIK